MQQVQVEWTRVQGIPERLPEDELRVLYATASIQLELQAAPNELPIDPALEPGGYEAIEQRLRPAPSAFAPGFFILGMRPKSGDPTVLGETFGIRHGLGAVYLANLASATGFVDPGRLLHTAAHEIGHLCNLAHGFAAVSNFPSVMVPARFRTVAPPIAWGAARQEALARQDPSWIDPPLDLATYPFNIICRQQLTFQPSVLWRPWMGNFAGSAEGPDTTHDRGVVLSAHQHREMCVVGDDLAFDLEIISQHDEPITLPLNLHPDFGTLEITIQEPSGAMRRYEPSSHPCSDSTWLLRQGERRIAPVAILGDREGAMLRQPGRHWVQVRLRVPHVPRAAHAGECRFEVIVRTSRRKSPLPGQWRTLSTRKKASLLAKARDGHDLGSLHHASLHQLHEQPELIELADAPGAPRAVRHCAALRRAAHAAAENRASVVAELLAQCETARDAVLRYKLMHFIHRKDQP